MKLKLTPKITFLLLTIAIALAFGLPHLHYMDALSQGDHGRDLYAADQVTQGQLPYKDFWWVYGPLMPYYYGLFFKIFGTHIWSMLLGQMILSIGCAACFYLTALNLMSPGWAFFAAASFVQTRQEFFFTFNHIGGILCALIISFCLFSYIRTSLRKYLIPALITSFIFMLIKINFGLAAMVGILLSVWGIDWAKSNAWNISKRNFYLLGGLAIPAAALFIYWLLLKDLPLYAIRQCMPYFGDDQPHHVPPLLAVVYYLSQHWLTFVHSIFGVVLGIIFHGSTIYAVYLLATKRIEDEQRRNILLSLAVCGLFFVLYFHEFIVSGVWYRTYWSMPFLLMFHYIMLSMALPRIPKALRIIVLILLWGLLAIACAALWGVTSQQKTPERHLNMDRGDIYVGNEVEWTHTVNATTEFLQQNLGPSDLFFALPYDCLYYYLTAKRSPTRQLIFFNHIKVPLEQEISVIEELEKNKVNYVLMSNRIASSETGMGIFGQTYCPLIAKYIKDNFKPVMHEGGNWQAEPGWANNHGVIILKRK